MGPNRCECRLWTLLNYYDAIIILHKDKTCASLLIRSLALELNLQKDMLAGASHLYAHKLECFPHGIDSFPQPFGLIKKRYDDSDKDIRPCHVYRSVKEIMHHLEIKESMEMKK